MNIKITERQIRLILQEGLPPKKDVEDFLSSNDDRKRVTRSNEMENFLNNIFEKLKQKSFSEPEYNYDPDRLYFSFSEDVVTELYITQINSILEKINDYNKKNNINISYYIDISLFRNGLVQITDNNKKNEYYIDKEGNKQPVKYIYNQKLITVLKDNKNKIYNYSEEKLKKLFDKLSIYYGDSKKIKTENDYILVISKKPYDIVSMTSCRSWGGCMDMYKGLNREKIKDDIREGTLIAYLIKPDDLNIENPISRVLIKPFISENNPNDILYKPENKVYGDTYGINKYITVNILPIINNEKTNFPYVKNSKLYDDDRVQIISKPLTTQFTYNNLINLLNNNLSDDELSNDNFKKILKQYDDVNDSYLDSLFSNNFLIYEKINTYPTYIEKSPFSLNNIKKLKEKDFNKFEGFLNEVIFKLSNGSKYIRLFIENEIIKSDDKYKLKTINYLIESKSYTDLLFKNNKYMDFLNSIKDKYKIDNIIDNIIYAYNKHNNFTSAESNIFKILIENDILKNYFFGEKIYLWFKNNDFKNFYLNDINKLKKLNEQQKNYIFERLSGLDKILFKKKMEELK